MTTDIPEMNRAMARFLGYEFNNGWKKEQHATDLDKRLVGLSKPFLCRDDNGLCFHKSWTWLMEVWKPLYKQVQVLNGYDAFPEELYQTVCAAIIAGDNIAAHAGIYDLMVWREKLIASWDEN